MSHKTIYNPDTHIIETRLTGTILAEEVVSIMRQAVKLAKKHDCYLWLNDFTDAVFEFSTFDIYSFPLKIREITESLGENKYKVKRAVIAPVIDEEHKFAELVSKNKGQQMKSFVKSSDARDWLLGRDRPNS